MAGQPYKEIERIEKISSTDAPRAPLDLASEIEDRVPPNKDQFDKLMGVQKTSGVDLPARRIESGSVSLTEEVATVGKRADQATRASPELFVAQAQEVIGKIKELKDKLSTPNLEIKGSVKNLLHNKLMHIDESLKIALSKSGVEYQEPVAKTNASSSPIERFLGYLTDSQYRLETLSSEVAAAGADRNNFTPAMMLAMQVKVGFVQQELEFFTGMLNKALESTKTLMNVQV